MENLLLMMAPLFSSKLLLVLFFGTLFGLILGVLPGLGPTTGGALILPFTMTLDPLSAESGSKVIVKGKIKAPPVVGPSPGKTPKINPNKVPKNKTNKSFELNNGAIIKSKFSIYT